MTTSWADHRGRLRELLYLQQQLANESDRLAAEIALEFAAYLSDEGCDDDEINLELEWIGGLTGPRSQRYKVADQLRERAAI